MDPLLIMLGAFLLGRKKNVAVAPSPVFPPVGPVGPSPAPSPIVAPPYPSGTSQPTTQTPGMLKAIEIWHISMLPPAVAGSDVVGNEGTEDFSEEGEVNDGVVGAGEETMVTAAQTAFPHGWSSLPQAAVTALEASKAVALLKQWHKGGVLFDGPMTQDGRRAYVMTEHPPHAVQPVQPVPVPVPRPVVPQPGNVTNLTPPAPLPPSPEPDPGPRPVEPHPTTHQVTTVRKGEGLANIAIRLLGHEGNTAWPELRAANIPTDADGRKRSKIEDSKGGISPMLQPGHKLWVPDNWTGPDGQPFDPAIL